VSHLPAGTRGETPARVTGAVMGGPPFIPTARSFPPQFSERADELQKYMNTSSRAAPRSPLDPAPEPHHAP